HHVVLVHVLGQDEDADVGQLATDLARGLEPVVGLARRHADVHHSHVGLQLSDLLDELVGVAHLGHDLEPRARQYARDALAHQHPVLAEHYAHGMLARTVVPSPTALSTVSAPSSVASLSASPRSPEPLAGSAPPRPSSRTSTTMRSPSQRTATDAWVASAYRVT